MDKFIFFLLNFQGIFFKIKIFVTNSRKIISLQKKYILKYVYILSYYIITGNFCLVLRHQNEECDIGNGNQTEFAHIPNLMNYLCKICSNPRDSTSNTTTCANSFIHFWFETLCSLHFNLSLPERAAGQRVILHPTILDIFSIWYSYLSKALQRRCVKRKKGYIFLR